MALPKEPRQKMINIMYLVLTALLALNVSSEILNAFKTVDSSLTSTNNTINASTGAIMKSLLDKTTKEETREKATYWYGKAQSAQGLSAQMYNDIQLLKDKILKEAGYDPAKGDTTYKEDNLDIATRIMIEQGEGKKLYDKLAAYQKTLLAVDPLIGKELAHDLQINLEMPKVQNKSNKTWDRAYFHMVPTVAAITILSKFQNDVKTSENKVVSFCHRQVGQVEVIFDKFEPIIGQSSNYLMPGQELEIKAGIGAFNSQAQPIVSIGGASAKVENGVAIMKVASGGVGSHSIPVKITYRDQNNQVKTIDKTVDYVVGQTSTSVALDKMNVLFIGVENPVSIAGSGGAEQINASISQGSLVQVGPGKYIAKVTTPGDCNINVSIAGKSAGSYPFRVRSIPDPTPMVGANKSGAKVQAGVFKSQAGVRALLENFFYEAQFNVTGFTIIGEGEGFEDFMEANNSGAAWQGPAQNIVNRIRSGSIVTIENISCVGPDGKSRKLPSIVYNIK